MQKRFFCKYCVLFLMNLFLFASCSKSASSKGIVKEFSDENVLNEKLTESKVSEVDLKKFNLVFESMSERFKNEIKILQNDLPEFLNDLNSLLNEEKTFKQDDLSLFYLIDKKHFVQSDYVPKDLISLKKNEYFDISRNDLSLRPDVYQALIELSKAAQNDGIKLLVSSTYRSYEYQKNLFARYVKQDGVELAERYSARPGTSQHQLGVAIDFGSITDDFADTIMGKWLNQNAADYGWSLSFPKEYEDITGYMWECWHFRYIGKNACAMQKKWFNNVQQYMLEFIDAWKNA